MSEVYPLHAAIKRGDYNEVSSLLGIIEDINEENRHAETPLIVAIDAGDTAIVKLLLENGADPDRRWDFLDTYPIHVAAGFGCLDIIKLLVEKGVPIDRKTGENIQPIHRAAEEGHVDVVEYILDQGVNVDVTDRHNYTILHFAAKSGREDLVEFLLGRNARNLPNLCAEYPIHFAAGGGHLDIVKLLIKHGHNANERSFSGMTPFDEASYSGHLDVVEFFFEMGFFRNLTGVYESMSPLHQAVSGYNREIVAYFLEKGADINLATENGYTPLHVAAEKSRLDFVKYLIENGADINCRTHPEGLTALHFAARTCHYDIIDFLIQNGTTFIIEDDGECDIFNMVSKNTNMFWESDRIIHKETAKVIIKYIVLYNKKIQPNLPENFRFREELSIFWQECMCELEKMDTCFLKGTKISLYKILRNIFHEHKLAFSLFNENMVEKITDIEECIKQFPLYANLKDVAVTGIKKAVERQKLLMKSDVILDRLIIPHLPAEIRCNIFRYLTNHDLTNFIKSTEQFNDQNV